jgi:hypothetical protein
LTTPPNQLLPHSNNLQKQSSQIIAKSTTFENQRRDTSRSPNLKHQKSAAPQYPDDRWFFAGELRQSEKKNRDCMQLIEKFCLSLLPLSCLLRFC